MQITTQSSFLKTNKENYNPFNNPSKPSSNKFADWAESKTTFLSSSVTCDLLNYEPSPPTPSLSVIDHQPSFSSLLPPLQLKTCTSIPVDCDLLDMAFLDPTPNSFSKSVDFKADQTSKTKNPEVSWLDFSEMKVQDEKKLKLVTENGTESLLCFKTPISRPALISLLTDIGVNLETGFYLMDNEGKVSFLDSIPNLPTELTYYAKSSADNLNVMLNLVEKTEKIHAEVDVFSHTEFLSALSCLKKGVTLLKITREGEAKFKFFQLNHDQSSLLWYSSHKLQNETEIPFKKIIEIKAGQRTKNFEKLAMMGLSSLSFSIKYLNEGDNEVFLDVICKQRQEFDMIVTALKGLACSAKGEKISKQVLLGHVRRFLIMMQEQKPFDCKRLWELEEKDILKVEDYVLKSVFNEKELFLALSVIEKKHQKMYENHKYVIEEVMKAKEIGQDLDEENLRSFYPSFCKRYIVLQKELCEFSEQDLPNLKFFLDFIQLRTMDITKDPLESFLMSQRPEDKRNGEELQKYLAILNQEIWRLGLDVENLKDFVERIKDRKFHKGKVEKIADKMEVKIMNKFSELGDVFSGFGKSISDKIEALKDDLF